MNLENATAIPAQVTVAELPGEDNRIGVLTAKATFTFDLSGQVQLDTQDPFPVLSEDRDTPWGPLPTDSRARRSDKFEVMLLGNAHPPRGATTVTKVALSVGAERRELLVWGDRFWVGSDPKRMSISKARTFDRMPLTFERAFGGTVPVQLDSKSVLDLADPINPGGKGIRCQAASRRLVQDAAGATGVPSAAFWSASPSQHREPAFVHRPLGGRARSGGLGACASR
ncbi:MAG TPA: DUF2169 domain-containing protein [Polyangia bacterium]